MRPLRPRRDVLPFLVGFGLALALTSIRIAAPNVTEANINERSPQQGTFLRSQRIGVGVHGKDDQRSLQTSQPYRQPREKVQVVIGVQTAFTTDQSNPKYNYGLRRQALRSTWFPHSQSELDALQISSGIVLRFVIGHSTDGTAEADIEHEEALHGGFLRLPMLEAYDNLPKKTLLFFRVVLQRWNPKYIIKADDDLYLRLDRVPLAVKQWSTAKADYVGCMKNGPVFSTPRYRWYEPQHALLGTEYFTHCWGTIYVLSVKAAKMMAELNSDNLRYFANEDVTIGAWMLAYSVRHYDDRRLCSPECDDASIAVFDFPRCAGLCNAGTQLKELHTSEACHSPATPPGSDFLPTLPPAIQFPQEAK